MGPVGVGDVILASVSVFLGSLGAIVGVRAAWRSRYWVAYVFALGCAVFVAGVVGQRAFPSSAATKRLGAAAAQTSTPGLWDAGVSVPVIGTRLTPLAVVGLLIAAIGVSLILLFETLPDRRRAATATSVDHFEVDSV